MMYEVYRWVDGEWCYWGRWADRDRANEIALELRDTCDGVWVKEVQG